MSTNTEKTEYPLYQELSKHLKSGYKSGIVMCMVSLKNDTRHHKQFVKEGGLALLMKLFRFKSSTILNLLLSVLANACLNAHVRQEMRGSNTAHEVVSIMKNMQFGSTLHCRACRLTGNLAECSWHTKSLCDAGAVQALTDILKSKTNMQTYLTAIRAVRNIWTSFESSREEILEKGTIRSITAIFVREIQRCTPVCTELVKGCLKAMCAFLGSSDPRCSEQLRGENDAQGYRNIIAYCRRRETLAVKCLYSLCQIAECRPVLGSSGAIECLVTLVTEDEGASWEVLASLCLFCREAVNRARIKSGAGLEVMLIILKKAEHDHFHPMLLHGLAQFIFDDHSIEIMIKNGLLDVLVARLKQMTLELPNDSDEKGNSKKRSADSSLNQRTAIKFNRTNSGRFSLDYQRDDWSPGSAASICSSPPSTPPLPFYDNEIDENAEDNYSPVCSDSEWADNDEELQEEVESLKSFSSLAAESEEVQDLGRGAKAAANEQVNIWTLALLSRLSHTNEPVDRLADPATIEPLLAYIRASKNARASRILTRIVRNRAYLVPLLKQGFVFEAQRLHGSEQYTRQLCALSETGGALGELATILLRGQETHKLVIAVSIPFLIRSKRELRTLLKTHGGLAVIFNVLIDQEHELHENAISAVCQLAISLEIRPDTADKNHLDNVAPVICTDNFVSRLKPTMVTFELDDGTAVDACRNVLCQKSDVFQAMLEGHFSESGKRRVKLKNTSKEGLDTLLLAINGAPYEDRTIESLLDAVLLADKFLMRDVLDTLTKSSMAKLNFENFSRAWHWARKNECYELKISCIKMFLTSRMTRTERINAFREFSCNQSFLDFVEDIKGILTGGLSQW